MENQPLEDATHLGWRQQTSTGDDDHLLIRHDLGVGVDPDSAEPLLKFNNEAPPSTLTEASSSNAGVDGADVDDAAIDDAAIDAPPYLWGGEDLASEPPVVFGDTPSQETVFS